MKIKALSILSIALLMIVISPTNAQDCNSSLTIILKNSGGGFFASQKVVLISKNDGKNYEHTTNAAGEATFTIPCNSIYNVSISNYTNKLEIQTKSGGMLRKTLTYSADMVESDKVFAMSESEMQKVDKTASEIVDSIFVKGSVMMIPKNLEHFVKVNIGISDFKNRPIADEQIIFKGIKRNKKVVAQTDKNGRALLFVPKGDDYTLSFKYHKDYSFAEYKYTKGTSDVEMNISYLGTREIEKRKREEELRLKEYEKRIKEERLKFEEDCRKRKISIEEGYRLKMLKEMENENLKYGVVDKVFKRNIWTDKLIVCDLTGSMDPYTDKLMLWYSLNFKKEKNLQFVFFNDGDNIEDEKKIIGQTGGIYYSPSKGFDSLQVFVNKVRANGYGGDCAENNMEALIKGTQMAKPFKELVMIADNNSPIKDIELLKDFKYPVHIILCGTDEGWIEPHYLLLAWKTKGTIHTIEEDIKSIARMVEGQQIKIGKQTYRIMGGEFVRLSD